MVQKSLLILKRTAVFLPGLGIAFWAAEDLYPIFNRRLPVAPAILLTYIAMAYFIIPAGIRLIRVVSKPEHVPLYCTTPDGFASDPINIGIIASQKQVVQVMQAAGWHQAHKKTLGNMLRLILSTVLRKPYLNAPFSNLYLFGRSQDLGFQLPVDGSPTHRHHVRFWGCVDVRNPKYAQHTTFWKRHHKAPLPGQLLWLGAASKDVGLGLIRHNAQLTHMIQQDTNLERDMIAAQLKATGHVKRTRTIKIGKPYTLQNRVFRGSLTTDGKVKILTLKIEELKNH